MRSTASVCIAAVLLLAEAAIADDTHYQDYPVGGRAVALGGAFTGLGDDSSGIFYNPAGLVDARRGSVQVSSNLYGLEVSDNFSEAFDRVTDLDTVATELNIIPSSGSFVTQLGPPTARVRSAYGLGVFVPSYRSINNQSTQTLESGSELGCETLTYRRTLQDRTFHFGGAFSHRMDDTWSFGVSGFLAYRTLSDSERTSCFSGNEPDTTSFARAETDLRLAVAAILISLGVKANLSGGWSVGFTVATPSIRAWEFADLDITRSLANAETGRTEFVSDNLKGLDANTRWGTKLRIGVARVIPDLATFGLDLTLHAPTRYDLFKLPDERKSLRDSLTIVSSVQRNLVLNFNLGLEFVVSDTVTIGGGAFSNFSSSPRIGGTGGDLFEADQLPNVDTFGASAVLGLSDKLTRTRIGFTVSLGDGSDVVPRLDGLASLGADPTFVKTSFSQFFAFLFLSTTLGY